MVELDDGKTKKRILPPSPKAGLFFGHFFEFRKDTIKFFTECQKSCGDIFHIRLGKRTLHVICSPELYKEIIYHKPKTVISVDPKSRVRGMRLVLGNGLLTSSEEKWLPQRRMMQPIFSQGNIDKMSQHMLEAGDNLLRRWETYASTGETFDVAIEMTQVALDVICRTMFASGESVNAKEVAKALNTATTYGVDSVRNPFVLPLPWPTWRNLRFKKAIKTLDSVIYQLITQRKKDHSNHVDLLSKLIEAQDDETGARMTDRQIRDEVITIFSVGHESIASALTWTLYLLSQHSDVYKQLQDELRTVLGGRPPTLGDLARMPFLQAVFLESMRMYPPAPYVPRLVYRDMTVNGYHLAKNTHLIFSIYHIHRHPKYWESPNEFRPQRFLDADKLTLSAYMPFGVGPRQCIGNQFALQEGRLLLAQICSRYRVQCAPDWPVDPEIRVTMSPKYGMRMSIKPNKALEPTA